MRREPPRGETEVGGGHEGGGGKETMEQWEFRQRDYRWREGSMKKQMNGGTDGE